MQKIEQTLDSREVAEMIGKEHHKLLRDIRRYIEQLGESKIGFTDFFRESTYQTEQNKEMPCYRITKKGCEFIAHKLTGTKGTAFTARYINRFHEMQDMITDQAAELKKEEPELPWFIKKFRGRYVILWRDFKSLIGVDPLETKIHGWYENIIAGRCFSGWAEKDTVIKEEFKQEYGFDYGDDKVMMYLSLSGAKKVIRLLQENEIKIDENAVKLILNGINSVETERKKELLDNRNKEKKFPQSVVSNPTKIRITLDGNEVQIKY